MCGCYSIVVNWSDVSDNLSLLIITVKWLTGCLISYLQDRIMKLCEICMFCTTRFDHPSMKTQTTVESTTCFRYWLNINISGAELCWTVFMLCLLGLIIVLKWNVICINQALLTEHKNMLKITAQRFHVTSGAKRLEE